MLTKYNTYKGTSYTLSDLNAAGSYITTMARAVALSFDILGQYLENMRTGTGDNLTLLGTGWNGCICQDLTNPKTIKCFGSSNTGNPIPTAVTCYGVAINKLYTAYLPYCPSYPLTGQKTTYYYGDIVAVSTNPLSTYNPVCGGAGAN